MAYGADVATLAAPSMVDSEPAEFVREQWAAFLALHPKILDAQHRAAVAAYAAKQAGDMARFERGRAIIQALGDLAQLHHRVITTVEPWGKYIGLSAVAIPVAAATVFAGVALVIAWMFRRYDYLDGLADRLADGSLTPADLEALGDAAPATDVLAPFVDVGKLLLWGAALFLGVGLLRELTAAGGRARSNPPLTVFAANPPADDGAEIIGEHVYTIAYRHAGDSRPYYHDFRSGALLEGLPDGSIRIRNPRRRLWRDFGG